jgi:hypothetical protein
MGARGKMNGVWKTKSSRTSCKPCTDKVASHGLQVPNSEDASSVYQNVVVGIYVREGV